MKNKTKIWIAGLLSLIVGAINGLCGGGGGILCVPILAFCFGLSEKQSHASALVVILLTTICASVFYVLNPEIKINWIFLAVISAILIISSFIGTKLLKFAKNKVITILFAIILLGSGIWMVVR